MPTANVERILMLCSVLTILMVAQAALSLLGDLARLADKQPALGLYSAEGAADLDARLARKPGSRP